MSDPTETREEVAGEWHPLTAAMRCLEGALATMAEALVLAAGGDNQQAMRLIAEYMDNTGSLTDDDYQRIGAAAACPDDE